MNQRLNDYYAGTIDNYESMRSHNVEHLRSVDLADGLLGDLSVNSILDVGCGTGQVLYRFSEKRPTAELFGIDPSPEMVQRAAERLPAAAIAVGSGDRLPYADHSMSLVVATGIMHHIEHTHGVIAEMFRVSSGAVLISDHNNFAFGKPLIRRVRLALFSLGLHRQFYFVRNGFRRQGYSEEDGYWYNYSLLDDYKMIATSSERVVLLPTLAPSGGFEQLLLCQTHLAVLAFV